MTDDGSAQGKSWDPERYEGGHEFVYEYGRDVLDLLEPQPGERILDLGCGTGHLTNEIAAAVGTEGTVVGIDSSEAMIDEARAAYPAVDFAVADGTAFSIESLADDASIGAEPFDAVFSNAALHWITDQAAVTDRVREALRPGGRYVAELGGRNNVDAIVSTLLDAIRARGANPEPSWYFPSIGEHTSLLEEHGFEPRFARLFDRPTPLDDGEAGLRNWIATFGDALLAPLDEAERAAAVATVEEDLRPTLYDPQSETWTADYRRLRFVAVRE